VEPAPPRPTDVEGARSYIAAIGIDRYRHSPWGVLQNAVSDARGAMAAFENIGFEPVAESLFDEAATKTAIQRLVTTTLQTLQSNDNLVIFFAGHGHTEPHSREAISSPRGYIASVDAGPEPDTWINL